MFIMILMDMFINIYINIIINMMEGRKMENAIITAPGTALQGQEMGADLFSAFVAYIGRGQKTTRTYLCNLRQFVAWMRYQGITAPTRQDILSYRQWLTEEHPAIELDTESATGWKYRTDSAGNPQTVTCQANTVKQYMQTVKAFFKWTAAEGLYRNVADNIHPPKIRTDTHRKDGFSAQEVRKIENSIAAHTEQRQGEAETSTKDTAGRIQRTTEQGKRLYAMYLLAVNAGLRTVEISRVNVEHLEQKGDAAFIYIQGKGHSEADTKKPIAREVYAAIVDYLNSRTDKPTGSSPLFVSTGNRSHGKRIAPTTISTMLKTAMQEAGFDSKRLTAHSLRHSTGESLMEITGSNIYQTQQYMRHSNPATTEIYLNTEKTAQDAELAQRLYNHFHGTDSTSTAADRVKAAMRKMNPAQLEQLANIAAAMTAR